MSAGTDPQWRAISIDPERWNSGQRSVHVRWLKHYSSCVSLLTIIRQYLEQTANKMHFVENFNPDYVGFFSHLFFPNRHKQDMKAQGKEAAES